MGAVLAVPFATAEPWPDMPVRLREAGFTVAALSPRTSGRPISEFARQCNDRSVALLLGAEGQGLTGAAIERADVVVRIGTTDAVDSLNLAVACGIAASHLFEHLPHAEHGRNLP